VGVVEASKGHFYDWGRVSDQFSVEQNKVWKFWFLRTHMMRGNKITGEVEASTGYSHDGGQISGELLLIRTSYESFMTLHGLAGTKTECKIMKSAFETLRV
jgi:hypothetical protein